MKIGFIGAGKVGFTLGKYFAVRGLSLTGYYSRSSASALSAAEFTGSQRYSSIVELVEKSDLLFITAPDSAIAQIWNEVKRLPVNGKIVCHCSGLLTSAVFSDAEQYGACGYSLHPLYAISDKYRSFEGLSDCYFTLEGSNLRINELLNLIRSLGNPVETIAADKKIVYHASCVMLSNLTVALAKLGSDLMADSGLSDEFSAQAWRALFLNNAANICQTGLAEALTGPLERDDVETVRKHIDCLEHNARDVYISLSNALLDVAKQKHPERDYVLIETELNK